jgi:hypothetical protein
VSFVIVLAARHFPSNTAAYLLFCAVFLHSAAASCAMVFELLRQIFEPAELHLLWRCWLPGKASRPGFRFQSER